MATSSSKVLTSAQLTGAGNTAWINLASIKPRSASARAVLVLPASFVGRIEYSNDASTVIGTGVTINAISTAGTYIEPISTAYAYVRMVWVSGTATSLNFSIEGEMVS